MKCSSVPHNGELRTVENPPLAGVTFKSKLKWPGVAQTTPARAKEIEPLTVKHPTDTTRRPQRRRLNLGTRLQALEASGPYCRYCGDGPLKWHWDRAGQYNNFRFYGWEVTFDHVIPVSKGGTNDVENLVVCCWSCNTKKGVKDAPEILPASPISVLSAYRKRRTRA